VKFLDLSFVFKPGHWPARMVVAEETEKILMRTSQDEDQQDAI
jgi:hypothetical protein